MILRRIARPLLATAFVASGVDSLRNPGSQVRTAQPVLDRSRDMLPAQAAAAVPSQAETAIRINGAVQVGAGILLATGKAPRLAAAALAGSLVPTTVTGTDFWNEADPAARAAQRNAFIKNVSLVGGALLAAADTEGKPSLAWRGRAKAEAAREAVASAFDNGGDHERWDAFVEKAQEGAHLLGERTDEAAEQLREGAAHLGEEAVHWGEIFRDRAPEVAEKVRERAPEMAEKVRERAPEFAHTAREQALVLADQARDQGERVAEEGRRRWRRARG